MRRLKQRATLCLGGVVSALLVLTAGLAPTAQAAPSTKYYTAAVSPAAVGAGLSQQSFTLTLANCGPAASSGCAATQPTCVPVSPCR